MSGFLVLFKFISSRVYIFNHEHRSSYKTSEQDLPAEASFKYELNVFWARHGSNFTPSERNWTARCHDAVCTSVRTSEKLPGRNDRTEALFPPRAGAVRLASARDADVVWHDTITFRLSRRVYVAHHAFLTKFIWDVKSVFQRRVLNLDQ